MINRHKTRFNELVGNRSLPEDQNEENKVALITEPVASIQRFDELKRQPFYALKDAALQRLTAPGAKI